MQMQEILVMLQKRRRVFPLVVAKPITFSTVYVADTRPATNLLGHVLSRKRTCTTTSFEVLEQMVYRYRET